MSRFSTALLRAELADALPPQARNLVVAFSGGMDSTVLLHALADLRDSGLWGKRNFELRAIHIDHQLQAASAQWSEHCLSVAENLSIPCTSVSVHVQVADEGVEAAARRARYDALRSMIGAQDALLTAHHANDQLETVLLALMRGAGAAGLSGSPRCQRFGAGLLVRPMLPFTRRALEVWARDRHLRWIEDPTNDNAAFDRNFLRAQVTPILERRWPAAASSATRSAAHLSETSQLLEALADIDLESAGVGPCLDLSVLALWPSARRRNVLRAWLKRRGIRAPTTRKLGGLEHDIFLAQPDRVPSIEIDGAVLRRYRDLLYCDPIHPVLDTTPLDWRIDEHLELPAALGSLSMQPAVGADERRALSSAKLPSKLTVRFREGGETLRPGALQVTKELKKLLQESAVLPWWRARLPLIYAGEALVAVGDLWIDANFAVSAGEAGCKVTWHDKPGIHAL